jgi:hypothetical protein
LFQLSKKERVILDRYSLDIWKERDRIQISFYEGEVGDRLILNLVDDDARQAIEDGFIDMRNPFWTCYKYAKMQGLIKDQ